MIKNISKIIIILIIYLTSCYYIYKNEKVEETNNYKENNTIVHKQKDDSIGRIIIDKIDIDRKLYEIGNPKNNIEENITILKGSIEPDNINSIMFIAAHSGYGEKAFFKDLNLLEKNDIIILSFKNIDYIYVVKNKWETDKDGDIEVEKENKKQLILTTCSPSDKTKQLIINCIEKES